MPNRTRVPGRQMPPLAAKLVDDAGVALVRAFVATLPLLDAGVDGGSDGG